jgi:WD40 repeat protein
VNKLATVKTLIPGHVLTIDDPMFGASHDIIVTNIDFSKNGEVKISGARMSVIEDWDDLAQDVVTVRSAGTGGWQIYTADGTLNKLGMPTEDDILDLNKGDFYTMADGTIKTVL